MPLYFQGASRCSSLGGRTFKNMRPACSAADLAAILVLVRYLGAGSGTMRAFAGRLSYQHAALPTAHQADITVLAVFACAFTPGTSFRGILHHRHNHIYILHR